MTQYYIVEIQQLPNGEYAHLVHWAFDADPDVARLKAESKYHQILASAAISETKKHSAVILSDEAFPCMHQCYKHAISAPEPAEEEPEDEPAEENGGGGE